MVTAPTPGLNLNGLSSDKYQAKLRMWKLLDPGRNSCYANTSALSILWLESFSTTPLISGPLGVSLRSLAQAGKAVDVWTIIPWISATRLWVEPRRQHDIAEFLLYLSTHLSRTLIAGTWGAAGSAPRRGLEVMDGGHTWPLLLAGRPASADDDPTLCDQCSLQDLFSHWHAQAEPRALIEPPAFCAVQVGRFGIASDGSCLKTGFQLQLEPFVHIPVFRANLQDVYFLKYHVRACAVHHGPTPSSGHYRSVLLPSDGAINKAFYTDDNATARKIKSSELVGIQRNAYIVFLQRTD